MAWLKYVMTTRSGFQDNGDESTATLPSEGIDRKSEIGYEWRVRLTASAESSAEDSLYRNGEDKRRECAILLELTRIAEQIVFSNSSSVSMLKPNCSTQKKSLAQSGSQIYDIQNIDTKLDSDRSIRDESWQAETLFSPPPNGVALFGKLTRPCLANWRGLVLANSQPRNLPCPMPRA